LGYHAADVQAQEPACQCDGCYCSAVTESDNERADANGVIAPYGRPPRAWISKLASKGLPQKAVGVAESSDIVVFINQEVPKEDEFGTAISSVWVYDKSSKNLKKLLTTVHPTTLSDDEQQYMVVPSPGSSAVVVPKDKICVATRATIIPFTKKIVLEGTADYHNQLSFIVDTESGDALLLPCNEGLTGFTNENSYLICQSHMYRLEGGRFTFITIFNEDGGEVASLSLDGE
jgi:hypothetical protein